MPNTLARVVCIRYWNFKQKIRLVKRYIGRGYRVEVLDSGFVYAERGVKDGFNS
jgi:hypothetical protein